MKVLAFNFSFPNQVSFSLITLHKNVPSKLVSQRNSVAIIISMGIFCTKANASTIMQLKNKNKTHFALYCQPNILPEAKRIPGCQEHCCYQS